MDQDCFRLNFGKEAGEKFTTILLFSISRPGIDQAVDQNQKKVENDKL